MGALDEESGRFECHLAPMLLSVGQSGMKMNWTDVGAEGITVIKAKPTNMQPINISSSFGSESQFEQLRPAQKVLVLRAQKSLWDESALFKDGKRRPPNVVSIFGGGGKLQRVALVQQPQPGVVPEAEARNKTVLVVRRELDADSDGVDGFIYVLASSPRVLMSYTSSTAGDSGVLEGKPAADAYLKLMNSVTV